VPLRAFDVGDREHAATAHRRQYFAQPVRVTAADEQDVAVGDVLGVLEALHDDGPGAQRFTAHHLVDGAAERVVAEDADDEGRAGRFEHFRGPFHELPEVE
jgi:hypothetical protein